MKFYFAPMEGVTGYVYRNAHTALFHNVDKYFMPFIAAKQNGGLMTRELHDILPENNQGAIIIPQILTNSATDFIRTANQLKEFGYDEVNLNLGCPSGTVVSKKKGSGFLAHQEELNQFLAEIFREVDMKISIKTRHGRDSHEEFYDLIQLYNQYPMEELIIHPRIQKDMYKNTPNMEVFLDACKVSKNKICYNGDIFTAEDYKRVMEQCESIDRVMLGRGLIANPGLITEIVTGQPVDKAVLKEFHDRVYAQYQVVLSGERNVLFKMKELWFYMIHIFSDYDKYAKKIRKSQRLADYEEAVNSLFREQEIVRGAGYQAKK